MVETLFEWTENYFKHKDIFEKKLKNINKKDNILTLEYLDRKDITIISPVLENEIFDKLKDFNNLKKYIICAYSMTNVDFVIKNWKKFLISNLIIIFVNIKINKKVLLNPFIHNKICDEATLESGIRTLFSE